MKVLILLACITLGHIFALGFGYWHWSIYKKRMIFLKEKAAYWVLRCMAVLLCAWLLPYGTFHNTLVIGSVLWFMYDAFMGYKIKGKVTYTGTQSHLDILANGHPAYFWFKLFSIIVSIVIYFL